MLQLANTKENQEDVKRGNFLWRSPEGVNFYDTKHGIVMMTSQTMCVVTPKEFSMMKNTERPIQNRAQLHG